MPEQIEEVAFDNPVMTAIGVTNKPHIMGLQPISTFDKDGPDGPEKWVKVPILILGRWLHRNGILKFTNEVVERIRNAMHSGIAGHDVALDARHESEKGAAAWVKDLIVERLKNGKDQVSALGKLTRWGLELLEEADGFEPRFKYGSIEFHPNFQSRMASESSALSFDGEGNELVFLEEGEQPDIQVQEDTMPDETQPAVEQVNAVSLDQLESFKLEYEQKLQEMETRLEAERSRSASLEGAFVKQFIDGIVIKAENYRDNQQRAHSKVFLEWLENVLLEKPISETICLEEGAGTTDVRAYYRKAIAELAQTQPGVVPMAQPETQPNEERMSLSHDGEPDKLSLEARNEIRSIWGKAPEKGKEE